MRRVVWRLVVFGLLFSLMPYEVALRPSFGDSATLGRVHRFEVFDGDAFVSTRRRRFTGEQRLRLLCELSADPAGSPRAKFRYHFETFGDFRLAATATRSGDPEQWLGRQRGLGCEDGNAEMLLVKAPVEAVAPVLAELRDLPSWSRDAWGLELQPGAETVAVFRLRGHSWTVVGSVQGARLAAADAGELSRRLAAESLYLAHSDTAGVVHYALFDHGRRVEAFYSGEPSPGLSATDFEVFEERGGTVVAFTSELRSPGRDELEGHSRFADAFLKRCDAFAPPEIWHQPGLHHGRPARLELNVPRQACERLDGLSRDPGDG